SRRRHTRCLSDWSSDVCSSDLPSDGQRLVPSPEILGAALQRLLEGDYKIHREFWRALGLLFAITREIQPPFVLRSERAESGRNRSEERRVGKECRERWW